MGRQTTSGGSGLTRKGIIVADDFGTCSPRHSGSEQAARAGLRQTHGVLPPEHLDV